MLGPRAVAAATLVFNLTSLNFENSVLTPKGKLLLTTAETGSLLEIDPTAAEPYPLLRATFGGAGILGIAHIEPGTDGADRYAVVGGIASNNLTAWANASVYTVALYPNASSTMTVSARLPSAQLLDGVVALPAAPNVVLVSDALAGVVHRVDTSTGANSIVKEDAAFAGAPGVNGLKIRDGFVYFVNSATGDFGRWAITPQGDTAGNVEIIASDVASDDFQLAADGRSAFLTRQHAPFDVFQLFLNGSTQSIAQPPAGTSGRPCSVVLASNSSTGYFTTSTGEVFKWAVPSIV